MDDVVADIRKGRDGAPYSSVCSSEVFDEEDDKEEDDDSKERSLGEVKCRSSVAVEMISSQEAPV